MSNIGIDRDGLKAAHHPIRYIVSTMAETHKIYISLLDEGSPCWRPVDAEFVRDDHYKIKSVNSAPEDEHWQFATGTVVRCEEMSLSEGKALVAVEEVDKVKHITSESNETA